METVQGGGAPCSGDLARPIQGLADWSPVPPPAMAAVCRKHQGSGHVGLVFSQAVGFVYGAQFRDGLSVALHSFRGCLRASPLPQQRPRTWRKVTARETALCACVEQNERGGALSRYTARIGAALD